MFANLFKWLLLKAFPAICLFMFLHFLRNVPSPRDQLGNWKRAQLVKMYSSGCQPLTTCNLPKMQPLPVAFGDGPNFQGTAGTVTSFGPQGELKCLESQKHLGNIKHVPIIYHQKASESNLKWRLLVDCLPDFIHLSLVEDAACRDGSHGMI